METINKEWIRRYELIYKRSGENNKYLLYYLMSPAFNNNAKQAKFRLHILEVSDILLKVNILLFIA